MHVPVNSWAWRAGALAFSLCLPTPAATTDPGDAALAQAKSRFANLGTNRVHYVELGQGPPTVVHPGPV